MIVLLIISLILLVVGSILFALTGNCGIEKYDKDNITFIHIGKTGGSSVTHNYKTKEIHHRKPPNDKNKKYFTILRDPLDRTISAFNMYLAFVKLHDSKKLRNKYNLNNGSPVNSTNLKSESRIAKIPYKTLNEWAEALGSDPNAHPDNLIKIISNNPGRKLQHIVCDHRHYLEDITDDQLVYIGVYDKNNFDKTLNDISKLLNQPFSNKKMRENKVVTDKYLSPLGKRNLMRYLKPEYDFLINRFGFYGNLDPEIYRPKKNRDFFSIIVRVRNEPYIEEFCRFHFAQGADRIYIQDDNIDDYIFPKYITKNKRIEIHPVEKLSKMGQKDSYQKLYDKIRKNSEWFAIIDGDEYLVPSEDNPKETVRDYLLSLIDKDKVVYAPWIMMAYTHQHDQPTLLETNVHREKVPVDYYYKSIFRSSDIDKVAIHFPNTKLNDFHSKLVKKELDRCFPDGYGINKNNNSTKIETCIKKHPILCYHYRFSSKDRYDFKKKNFEFNHYKNAFNKTRKPRLEKIPEEYMRNYVLNNKDLKYYYN